VFTRYLFIALLTVLLSQFAVAQIPQKYYYTGSDGTRVYFPMGKISFADTVLKFSMGFPRPRSKYRDSSQCLSKPNYMKYSSPDFVSLGCEGNIILGFTDNGFMNLKGPDLYVFEVGPSRERTLIEISSDGRNWLTAGITSGGTSKIDFSKKNIDSTIVFHYVRLRDLKDECSGKSAGADIDAVGAINSVMKLTVNADVLFDVDQYKLKSTAKSTLDSLAEAISTIENATILIEGHTDSDGDEEYNLKLSEDRCNAVRKKLERLTRKNGNYTFRIQAFGESKPRMINTSEENKQTNRRVDIMVLPPEEYFDTIPD